MQPWFAGDIMTYVVLHKSIYVSDFGRILGLPSKGLYVSMGDYDA